MKYARIESPVSSEVCLGSDTLLPTSWSGRGTPQRAWGPVAGEGGFMYSSDQSRWPLPDRRSPVETTHPVSGGSSLPGVLTGLLHARYCLSATNRDTGDAPTAEQEVGGQGWNGTGDVSPHSGSVYLNLRCEISVRTCDRRVRGLHVGRTGRWYTRSRRPAIPVTAPRRIPMGWLHTGRRAERLCSLSVPSELHHREVLE